MGSNAPKALEGVTRSILSILWADNLGLIFYDNFLAVQGQNMATLAGGLKMLGRCALQLFHVPWCNSWSFWCAFDVPLLPLLPLPFRWILIMIQNIKLGSQSTSPLWLFWASLMFMLKLLQNKQDQTGETTDSLLRLLRPSAFKLNMVLLKLSVEVNSMVMLWYQD